MPTPSRWCVQSSFAYGDVQDLLKMYCDKYCVLKFGSSLKMR